MPEYNVSKLKLPNGVILNLPGGSAAIEWLSETTVSSGTTETNGIEYTISTTNYKDGTTDTTYNNTFTVKNGTSSRPGVVYLTSSSADSSSASGTGDKTAATPLCVYNSIHDTDNALTLQNISAGTDDTTAYTITSSRLAYAVQAHDHLVEFSPSQDSQYVYDNTNKELKLNADIVYSFRDSTGHPGGTDLDIESTGYLEIPYGNNSNPGILKLSSAAATSSSASGNSDYTAATPKAVYDSIHSTSNVMPSATATAGTDTTTGYTLTAARLKEAIETFGGTTYDAIDESTDFWGIPYTSLSTDEKVISPKMLANFIEHASGRIPSYRLPANANLNDYRDCCHTYFCDTNSSNMTNLPIDVSCDGLGRGYFNLIPINIGIFSDGQILIAEDKDYIYFRRYRQGAWTAWRALGIPCMGPNILGSVYLTDSAATSASPSAIQSVAASPECVYNSIHASGNAASTSDYGVTILSTNAATSSASSSLAATPKCVYNSIRSSSNAADTSNYGVVVLSNTYTSTSSTQKSYAATAYAVGMVNSKVNDKMDQPTFISSLVFASTISSYKYAFSVFNGIAILNFTAVVGTSISSGSIKTILTSSGYIPSSYRPTNAVGFLASLYNDSNDRWDFLTAYVNSNGAIYIRPTVTINVGDTIRGSVSWTYDSDAWETG